MSKLRLIRLVIFATVIGLAICESLANRPAGRPVLADQAAQSGGQEKSAGQEFKNIQVLKDLPASQLRQAMAFFASSLGVTCDHCHVQPFEKDDKQAKQTARQMIGMMQRINSENFGGKLRVTCATCHQGHTAPVSMPPLRSESIARQGSGGADSAVTVDDVLDRYVKALGGREAIQRVTSQVAKGTITIPNGPRMQFQSMAAAPNKTLFVVEAPAGIFKEGFNGSTGWVKNQNGINDMSGAGLERTRQHADFYRSLNLKEHYASLKLVGKTLIGTSDVYQLRGENPSGAETMYFDSRTGLLVRWVIEEKTPFGPVPGAIDYEDYRDLGGVKVPFLVKRIQAGNIVIQKYDEVNQNVKVDPTQFEKPPAP